MMMQAVRAERMRCSNFVSFRRYLIRRHAHRPTPGFDPLAAVAVQARCDAASRCGVRGELVVSGYFVCSDKVTE